MFINEVPHSAELSAIIVNELRDLYGIKFRKDKKLKAHQVCVVRSSLLTLFCKISSSESQKKTCFAKRQKCSHHSKIH